MKKNLTVFLSVATAIGCSALFFGGCDTNNMQNGGGTSTSLVTEEEWVQAWVNCEEIDADGVKYFGTDNYSYKGWVNVSVDGFVALDIFNIVSEANKVYFSLSSMGMNIIYYQKFNGDNTLTQYTQDDGEWIVEELPLEKANNPTENITGSYYENILNQIADYSSAIYDETTESYFVSVDNAEITIDNTTFCVSSDIEVKFLDGKVVNMNLEMTFSYSISQMDFVDLIHCEFVAGGHTVTLPEQATEV